MILSSISLNYQRTDTIEPSEKITHCNVILAQPDSDSDLNTETFTIDVNKSRPDAVRTFLYDITQQIVISIGIGVRLYEKAISFSRCMLVYPYGYADECVK